MGLRDRALDALRGVFGAEREERAAAESPSAAALANQPPSMFSLYGRDEMGGLMSISQSLMDRFADYEAMEEFPDIGCVAEGCRVYLIEGSVFRPVPIEQVAMQGEAVILGFDLKQQKITKVVARQPRLTSPNKPVLALLLSNKKKLRVTPDHKILTTDGYIEAKDLKKGARIVSMWGGFDPDAITVMTDPRYGVLDLLADPTPDGSAKVYDITTDTHNFICEGAVIHNSAYRYYANDATQPSIENGRALWVVSEEDSLKETLDDLIVKKLRAEDDLYGDAYELGMYGNKYTELLVTNDGVIGVNHLPAPTMRRVDSLDGGLIGFVQDINGQFTANSHELRAMLAGNVEIPPSLALFEDWQVIHMRLRATRRRSPYGVSIAEPGRWVWKRLIILLDMAIIYKATRIPRYAIYVDVTDVPADRVESFLQKTKRDLRKRKMVNPRTGRLDMRYNVLSQDEDFIIAVSEGRERARVDVLSAPDWQTNDDLDLWRQMLHGSLGVPRAWLGQDEPVQSKGILSNEDVRAARTTLNMQREMRLGWERIGRVHLAARGMKDPWKPEFQVLMTVPSGIWELAGYETLNARADYASRVQPFVSVRYIQEKVLKLSDEQIKAIEKQRKKEQEEGLGAMPFGGGFGGQPPPPADAGPPEPGQPEAPPEEPGAPPPEEPGPNAPASEWKRYDAARRLEEWRYRESCRRSQEIEDKLGEVLSKQDDAFAQREHDRRDFFKLLKEVAFVNRNGHALAIPSGRRSHRNGS